MSIPGEIAFSTFRAIAPPRNREHFQLVGTPMRIEMKSSRNPFDEASQ